MQAQAPETATPGAASTATAPLDEAPAPTADVPTGTATPADTLKGAPEDNGLTWPRQRLLESGPGEFSYPAIIQTSDGLLHVVYTHRRATIQHVVMDAEWIDSI